MTESIDSSSVPNRGNQDGRQDDYLTSAAAACEAGDLVLGMHLYLAAYEHAAADPSIPDGMELTGLREAWNLACNLKERSIAEYVFEKLEPYLTGPEIAACANQLQSLALDRLEEYGFSREELEDMAEMISQDFGGGDASVVKVESISIPNMGMFGVPSVQIEVAAEETPAGNGEREGGSEGAHEETAPEGTGAEIAERAAGDLTDAAAEGEAGDDAGDAVACDAEGAADGLSAAAVLEPRKPGSPSHVDLATAPAADFNPYEEYSTSSIGKSYYAATNEGAGSFVFTRDTDRAEAGEKALAAMRESGDEGKGEAPAAPASDAFGAADAPDSSGEADASDAAAEPEGKAVRKRASAAVKKGEMPSMPDMADVQSRALSYATLAGYDEAVSVMREMGVGLQNDRPYIDFVNMLNEHHGFDRAPALDTILLRAPVIEDVARFVEATIGEIGLPVLRMSMEEGPQGVPVLCVTTYGNNRPRMNHAHNRFESPAILVIDDLDTWAMPEPPESIDGIGGFVMANISRGAREAVNLIRSSVEDPDVYVLATASTMSEPDPFFYELLEPMTIVDIGYPTEKERADIWDEIARNHPSTSALDRAELVRYSASLPRYDIYMAAREALEESYKLALAQRSFVPVTMQGMLEKLAGCQPLESDEYRALEDEVVKSFRSELDHLEDLLGESEA